RQLIDRRTHTGAWRSRKAVVSGRGRRQEGPADFRRDHSQHDGQTALEDHMRRHSPPAFPCWLLESVVPVPYREALLGDLIEEYCFRVESTSRFAASRWFWSQTCRSLPFLVWSSLSSGDWRTSGSVAIGVFVGMAVIKFGVSLTIAKMVAPRPTTQ